MATLNSLPFNALHFSSNKMPKRKLPPVYISTNPSHVDLVHLRHLLTSTNQSCDRFPIIENGSVKPVDLNKLRIALSNSYVVVSVFCKSNLCFDDCQEHTLEKSELGLRDLFQKAIPVSESNGRLVGFGRAVSDSGLTASIYDVAVIFPSMWIRRGFIGVDHNDVYPDSIEPCRRRSHGETCWSDAVVGPTGARAILI